MAPRPPFSYATVLYDVVGLLSIGLVYWRLTPQQQPGSYQGGVMMMMKSVFWWRKPEYPEETTKAYFDLVCIEYICSLRKAAMLPKPTIGPTCADTGFFLGDRTPPPWLSAFCLLICPGPCNNLDPLLKFLYETPPLLNVRNPPF